MAYLQTFRLVLISVLVYIIYELCVVQGKGNVTPLHVSAMKGYVNCVRMLLEADADIRLEDELGFTVFQKAERSKRREPVLRLLRSRGKILINKM